MAEGGRHPLTRAWSEPAVSPRTCERLGGEGLDGRLAGVDEICEVPQRSKFESV